MQMYYLPIGQLWSFCREKTVTARKPNYLKVNYAKTNWKYNPESVYFFIIYAIYIKCKNQDRISPKTWDYIKYFSNL